MASFSFLQANGGETAEGRKNEFPFFDTWSSFLFLNVWEHIDSTLPACYMGWHGWKCSTFTPKGKAVSKLCPQWRVEEFLIPWKKKISGHSNVQACRFPARWLHHFETHPLTVRRSLSSGIWKENIAVMSKEVITPFNEITLHRLLSPAANELVIVQ